MKSFEYCTPTRLVFGEGAISRLADALRPLGKKLLLAYGGGSVKKIGLYDKVKSLLRDFEIYELSDIRPNPKYAPSVLDGVRICKEKGVDAILALGGGSVLDCCKAISAGAKYDGDPWDLISGKVSTKAALPVVDVLTLAATGSEYDCGCVISRTETNDKVAYVDPHLFPVCSILDPTYTFSVPKMQTAAGGADAMSHIFEQYFVLGSTLLSDGLCEAVLRSLISCTKACVKNPNDYDARAEMMLCCSYACNGILSLGNASSKWECHAIEHALSAYYDITHGVGLAIITPHWMRHILNEKTVGRLAQYGVNVFGIDASLDKYKIAEKAIEETRAFYESVGLPLHLKDVGIDETRIDEMAHHVATVEPLDKGDLPLTEADIASILRASL